MVTKQRTFSQVPAGHVPAAHARRSSPPVHAGAADDGPAPHGASPHDARTERTASDAAHEEREAGYQRASDLAAVESRSAAPRAPQVDEQQEEQQQVCFF